MNMTSFLLIVAAFIIIPIFLKKIKEKERQQKIRGLLDKQARDAESFEIDSVMRVVDESIEIVGTSKNYDTVKSRLSIAIDKLQYLIARYPHRIDIKTALEKCLAHRIPVHTNALCTAVDALMAKAKLAKTIPGKTNAANKALLLLKDGLADEFVDNDAIKKTASAIQLYLNKEELKETETRAERFEFKGNFKKALDTYQDALFFLRRDNYDDSSQQKRHSAR